MCGGRESRARCWERGARHQERRCETRRAVVAAWSAGARRAGPRGVRAQALAWARGCGESGGSGGLSESVDGEGWSRGDRGGQRSRGLPAGAVPPRRLLRGVAGAIVVGGGCGQLGSSESAWALRWRGFAAVGFGGEGRRFYSSAEAVFQGGGSLQRQFCSPLETTQSQAHRLLAFVPGGHRHAVGPGGELEFVLDSGSKGGGGSLVDLVPDVSV